MQEFVYKMLADGTYSIMEYSGSEAHVMIPETCCGATITVLYDKLFRGHSEILSVHIPDCVTDLGEFVFDGCDALCHIELPSQLFHLWGYTFARCGIEEITIPDRVTYLPPLAFKDCKNLKKVVCGSGLREICSWAFGGCDNLCELIVAPNVKISPEAFQSKVLNT